MLRESLQSLQAEHAETSAMALALKEELTRFYKLPSPCGVGMDLEVDMRGSVRVAVLQPRMSAAASGAGSGDRKRSLNQRLDYTHNSMCTRV